MLKYFIIILCYIICKVGPLHSKDIREFEVGTNIKKYTRRKIYKYKMFRLSESA